MCRRIRIVESTEHCQQAIVYCINQGHSASHLICAPVLRICPSFPCRVAAMDEFMKIQCYMNLTIEDDFFLLIRNGWSAGLNTLSID